MIFINRSIADFSWAKEDEMIKQAIFHVLYNDTFASTGEFAKWLIWQSNNFLICKKQSKVRNTTWGVYFLRVFWQTIYNLLPLCLLGPYIRGNSCFTRIFFTVMNPISFLNSSVLFHSIFILVTSFRELNLYVRNLTAFSNYF